MDIFSKNKFLTIVITILVILNLGTIASVWIFKGLSNPDVRFVPNNDGPGKDIKPADALDYFALELKLSPEQRDSFKKLRKDFFDSTKKILDSIHENKKRIIALIGTGSDETEKVLILSENIAALQKQIELNIYNHFRTFEKNLDENQKEKFKILLNDLAKERKRREPPPPPHENGIPDVPPPPQE